MLTHEDEGCNTHGSEKSKSGSESKSDSSRADCSAIPHQGPRILAPKALAPILLAMLHLGGAPEPRSADPHMLHSYLSSFRQLIDETSRTLSSISASAVSTRDAAELTALLTDIQESELDLDPDDAALDGQNFSKDDCEHSDADSSINTPNIARAVDANSNNVISVPSSGLALPVPEIFSITVPIIP